MAQPKQEPRKEYDQVPPDVPNIFQAASQDDVEALERALPHYGVNAVDELRMTPLHHAAAYDAHRAVDRLLAEPGIDPTATDIYGRRAADVPLEVLGPQRGQAMFNRLTPICYPRGHVPDGPST